MRGLMLICMLCLSAGSLMSFSADALAQTREVAGAQDSPYVQRFAGSSIVGYRQTEDTLYTLVLGRMQRVDGRVTPGHSERIQGRLTRITYEIPAGYPAEDVYAYFRRQLLQESEIALFGCQGRDCGSSNFWANEVFGNRILYGPEANQYYLVTNPGSSGEQGSNVYVALYVITRANRRVYAHLDIVEPPRGQAPLISVSPEAVLQLLSREGGVTLPGISFDEEDNIAEDSGIDLAVRVLRRELLLQVYVVGHLQDEGSTEALIARSERRAQHVRQALIDAGIDAGRITAYGVGPLAPVCSSRPCDQRIELVRR